MSKKTCRICGNNDFTEKEVDYTYEDEGKQLTVRKVPCHECNSCGEQYLKAVILKAIEKEFNQIHNVEK